MTHTVNQANNQAKDDNQKALENYYQFHAKVYNLSRWSFLFGREKLVRWIEPATQPNRILEIGCGTGKNLVPLLEKFPEAAGVGLDLSTDMLSVARQKNSRFGDRISFVNQRYESPFYKSGHDKFDLILMSYSLTMINPGWEQVIESAYEDLNPGGQVAVVDFHDSNFPSYKRWMGVNHVRLDGHLLPKLKSTFKTVKSEVNKAYFGWWEYMLFLGQK